MNAFIGMATDKGIATAETIEGHGTALASLCPDIEAFVHGVEWVGEDRDSFVGDYMTLAESVDSFCKGLVAQAGVLRQQAQAQDSASSAAGAAPVTRGNASAQ